MAYEQRDNSGSIFVNDRKETEKHPDRSGKAMIGGKMYWISGWLKESAKGKYLSLSFKPMDERPAAVMPGTPSRKDDPISSGIPGKRSILPPRDDMNGDDVPF